MINIRPSSHHISKAGITFLQAAQAGGAKEPEVVALAQQKVPLRVQRLTHLTQSAITAATLEAILMPILVNRLENELVVNLFSAASTLLRPSLPCCCHPYAGDHPPPLPM